MSFPEKRHPAYDHIDAESNMKQRHGKQAGDPKKGAKAMYELAILPDPPLRMVIGSDAWSRMQTKIKGYGELYSKEEYNKIANSTDAEGYQRPS
jgi:hypothetical protein